MKLSTLARRVAEFYEGGGRWRRGHLKKNGGYCALGAASRVITLSEMVPEGSGMVTDVTRWINRLHRQGKITDSEFDEAIRKAKQVAALDEHFRDFSLESGLVQRIYGDGSDVGMTLITLNDDSTRKVVIEQLREYSKWLRRNRL